MVKNLAARQEIWGLIPGSGRSPGVGNGNPLQYSCLENPMDRGDWRAMVHRVTKSQTQLRQLSTYTRHIYDFKIFNSIKPYAGTNKITPTSVFPGSFIVSFYRSNNTYLYLIYPFKDILYMIITVGNTSLGCTMYRDVLCDSLI